MLFTSKFVNVMHGLVEFKEVAPGEASTTNVYCLWFLLVQYAMKGLV